MKILVRIPAFLNFSIIPFIVVISEAFHPALLVNTCGGSGTKVTDAFYLKLLRSLVVDSSILNSVDTTSLRLTSL